MHTIGRAFITNAFGRRSSNGGFLIASGLLLLYGVFCFPFVLRTKGPYKKRQLFETFSA